MNLELKTLTVNGTTYTVQSPDNRIEYNEGYEAGIKAGYQVDPSWTDFSYLCFGDRLVWAEKLRYSDTSNCTNFTYMFGYGLNMQDITKIPSIDTSKGKTFVNMFLYSFYIKTIGQLNLCNAEDVSRMFMSCRGLENVSFVPGSIPISISFGDSYGLTGESIQSIVDGLKDLTGGTTQTLTLHADSGGQLTDEQKALITAKNWTLVY